MIRDPFTQSFHATQNRAAIDRSRRGVIPCACGAEYQPTSDGRRRHRFVHGHTPQPRKEGDD